MKVIMFILMVMFSSVIFAQTYTYDQSGRVIGVKYDNGQEIGYKYDNAGNLKEVGKVALEDTSNPVTPPTTDKPSIDEPDDGKCFIATASFGSYLHKDVKILRNFRDKYLLTNKIGTFFVEDVYYKYSPPIANYIAESEILKTITRWFLTPIIYSIKYPLYAFLLFISMIMLLKNKRYKRLN